ncbi:hypothetical protein [Confluentibacter flavum]|uniref:Calx-beta domain-containing protein n=1 Tax=Confluentibacter flavum TaxID=1909700 RepID=A0A2N3HF46_9FLAO|nr:hypothetical protein [Confluentibacter flavum]PKQ43503.1 hypothetical protein CSW08_17670 [Confluentibacter flavum]
MKTTIKTILMLFLSLIVMTGCENDSTIAISEIEYISFGDTEYTVGIDPGGSATVVIPVYTGNIVSSDRTFNISVDGTNAAAGSFLVPSNVTIPGGTNEGSLAVNLSDVDLGIGINNILIEFAADADTFVGAATEVNYSQNCSEVTATLAFVFDFYSEETGWRITDALGGIVASKPIGTYAGRASASESIQLCSGRDYTLVVTDQYGDGMFDGTNLGSYTLTIGGVVKVSDGGSFGATQSNVFDTN